MGSLEGFSLDVSLNVSILKGLEELLCKVLVAGKMMLDVGKRLRSPKASTSLQGLSGVPWHGSYFIQRERSKGKKAEGTVAFISKPCRSISHPHVPWTHRQPCSVGNTHPRTNRVRSENLWRLSLKRITTHAIYYCAKNFSSLSGSMLKLKLTRNLSNS